ncbi:Asp-tRNA(Asn)/Glu-tRNA(Gln) amidotransferase subunit GatA [Akkermansiaceae bacterium]|jgi:aspartyl-tRNA(Asn)/glutamyl-tRNA(Gln) amidotransferase subunit A|nr:Asp-tRNA(Asn)/Glu-tRNA(Gln) amidotransferase subunit GatA [Akkermansiaceae bacterium]MDB4518563.1 Asp-tRNA(Asn)/Glu-tRNA(Gln) amidotransferase subunit GatA [Akkermansiaceae bacterium]|tara:strand:+ start:848 stop:2263 length:1416 start_codon:yes stop_codon:yes gene_type:complete
MSLASQSLSSLRRQLTAGNITSRDIVQDTIEQISARDGEIKAFLSHDPETALAEAEKADLSLPLGGLPIGIKDNINVRNHPCSCASKFLEGAYHSPYDATAVIKLRAAGAIPFGRLNLDEFAMGSSTENSALQITQNPKAPGHIPGGSSGGSAAAVAGDLISAALGSDTGGSIRQPASHCGVVGLKPSYGRVSRYGLVAFGSSLDQIGPLTRTVEDSALLLNALAGGDLRDSTSLDDDVPDYTEGLENGVAGMKLGLPKEYFTDGIDAGVRARVEKAAADLEAQGAEIIEISLPHTEYAVATYYIIAPAEASSNLSRFDGIRYGNRSSEADDILSVYQKSREEGFGSEVKRRIILGTYVLSSGYYDAYYSRALKVRTLIRRDFEEAFEKVDAILTPVTPETAPKIGAAAGDPLKHYLADIFTISANLAGNCGISVPLEPIDGKPVGLQILGPHLGEKTILRTARAVEALGS